MTINYKKAVLVIFQLSRQVCIIFKFPKFPFCHIFYNGLFQKTNKQTNSGSWGHTFLKNPPGIFHFFTLPLEIPDKTEHHPWKFCKVVFHPLEIPSPKTKTPGNSTWFFFLVTPGNSTSFLINLWKFHMLFLWYPWKFHIFNPLPCLFIFLE